MMPVLMEVFAKWRQKDVPFRNLCLDIKPGNKGVQEKRKGVMITINYHSDNDVFLVDRNIYFRGRVCFNGTVCASDLVFI